MNIFLINIWQFGKSLHYNKKINGELIHNKKYLEAEKKKLNTKESFQCFYIPTILFDSVNRKDGNSYPKVFLEKFIYNFFWRNIRNFGF